MKIVIEIPDNSVNKTDFVKGACVGLSMTVWKADPETGAHVDVVGQVVEWLA